MKRLISLFLIIILCLSLAGCSEKTAKQDSSPITILVCLGNSQAYYEQIRDVVKENLGYDLKFVYEYAIDTTNAVRLQFKNNDLPADIVATASLVSEDYLRDSALDLMSYTHLSDSFTYQKTSELATSDGKVYQFPFTTRLIGITYNKTLMDEMGWEVPTCFADMLDLKKQCDEAGIPFAVSAGVATGHGFNYLFHTMGAQWLSTLDGTQWLNDFLDGDTDISEFKKQASYFEKWVDNGLFGTLHDEDWNASAEYCSRRALFFFDLTNSVYTYDGDLVDENGKVIGTTHDEFKSIPWISEDGSNNCYTYYDNMYLYLNKNLANPDQADKLDKCVEILEFLTTDKAADIFKNIYNDGYVAIKDFNIDETRTYSGSKYSVERGYLMPWYYSKFDNDSIVLTGQLVNNYIKDGSSSLDEICQQLEDCRDNYLNQEVIHICDVDETFDYAHVAMLNCIGALKSYQSSLNEQGIAETAQIALIPYAEKIEDVVPFTAKGVVSTKAYSGELVQNDIRTIISARFDNVVGIHMNGSELKSLAEGGLSDGESVYPYMVKGENEASDGSAETGGSSLSWIDDDSTYLVVTSSSCLADGLYDQYLESGRIITDGDVPVTASILNGLEEYLSEMGHLSMADVE